MINQYPKKTVNNRMTYQVVSHFLNALIEDQLTLENIVSPEVMERLKGSYLSRGLAYDKQDMENKLYFDKELEHLFDENSKKIIEKLYESKFFQFNNRKIYTI